MKINPDDKHQPIDFMFGVLEREFNGRANSAVEFITAERCEVVLSAEADDRCLDPLVLAAEVDRMAVAGRPALLAYATLCFPDAVRLHRTWRAGFGFAQALTDRFGVGTIAALHVPGRPGSPNAVHLHLMMMGPRKLTAIGLGQYEHTLCFARGQTTIGDLWDAHRASAA